MRGPPGGVGHGNKFSLGGYDGQMSCFARRRDGVAGCPSTMKVPKTADRLLLRTRCSGVLECRFIVVRVPMGLESKDS